MSKEGKPAASAPVSHRWKFFRAGGFDQARLETGADLMALEALDQKLWVALSCPVNGISFDPRTLAFVDTEGDGHIRAPEILAAVRWAGSVLKDADLLVKRQDRIPLSAIRDDTEEGKAVLAGAKLVLHVLGKPETSDIALEDASDTAKIFSQARFNGDGIVPAEATGDASLGSAVEDIIACLGSDIDRTGSPGVTADRIERFYAEARALDDWRAAGEKPDVLPFRADTAAHFELYSSLKPRVEDYFRRCRLAAYDGRAAPLLSPSDDEYRKLGAEDLGGSTEPFARFPLAVPGPGKPLPLADGVNPAFSDPVRRFGKTVVSAILGDAEALSDAGWRTVSDRFAPYEAWLASKPTTALEKLDAARVKALLAEDGRQALLDLVARDKAVEPEVNAIASVEKLLRYCRHLHLLVNNFVCFRDFYTRKGKAMFQAGTLYLDGRSCELCVTVADPNRHAAIASLSRVYLVYCECVRRGGGEKTAIAAGITAGDSDQLMVGRNGVFYDREGQDWDATIVSIVEHPISIRQAFFGPYKRLARMVREQLQKMSAARARASEQRAAVAAIAGAERAAAGKPPVPPAPPFDVAKFAGIFAAIGLAVGAIGTTLAAVVTGLFRLAWWQVPLVLVGVVLVISLPAVVLAWFKLRARNLGPILDANGWAVNARAKINIPFGASLTAAAKLPENAERSLVDPFAEKKRPWALYLVLLAAAAALLYLWRTGYLAKWLGQ